MRVMVTGSRDHNNVGLIESTLKALSPTVVIHGEAPGADSIAKEWAMWRGIPAIGIPAAWDALGKSAGPIRNGWLLDEHPDLVVAFPLPQSRGTWDAVRQAKERGIPVTVVEAPETAG